MEYLRRVENLASSELQRFIAHATNTTTTDCVGARIRNGLEACLEVCFDVAEVAIVIM